MILKKPYAFFIKYFRLINLVLSGFVLLFISKLHNLYSGIKQIFLGDIKNYSNLSEQFIGFPMYLIIAVIILLLTIIIILLKTKKKPFKDYLFLGVYIIILIIYLFTIDNNLFYVLGSTTVELNTIKLYSDIALLIYCPLFYFFLKYFMIAIGFNLKKFNFTKDIIELKAESNDDEEIELILGKNDYKYKRDIRRKFRELKYYVLENEFFVIIICSILLCIGLSTFAGIKIFDDSKVKLKETFVAKGISYNVQDIYESVYNLNGLVIKEDMKYVIARVSIRNIGIDSTKINFNDIRLFYGKDYVYPNNYYNDFFEDLGIPYDKQILKNGESKNYIFIFQVPNYYKSNKYSLKFHVGGELYKTLKTKSKNLDDNLIINNFNLEENTIFNKSTFGNSNITFRNYKFDNKFINDVNENYEVIIPDNLNQSLLAIDYELSFDENLFSNEQTVNIYEFFDKYLSIEYNYNGTNKRINRVSIKKHNIKNKLIVSVPTEVKNSSELKVILSFRKTKIIYKIK